MIKRYTRPVMEKIWSDENKYKAWLQVEINTVKAFAELGEIPKEDALAVERGASFKVERILEIEEETRHDVVAFTRAVSESLGEEKKWVHYGLTSTDVVDTAYGYLLRQVNDILEEDMKKMLGVLGSRAKEFKKTVMIGRTHGIHGEPTTMGLKFALWYSEMERNLERFALARKGVEVGKISGAVGTFANTPPFVEEYVCGALGLEHAKISTQVLQRDRHAFYMSTLALVGSTIEKMATEIRHLQRTEVKEVEEFFRKGQKGSSAMPHKRNPISSENMCGGARVLRGYMVTAYEDINLWHERDISHSSAERIIIPDGTTLLDYMLTRFTGVLENLIVYPENMLRNMEKTKGLIFSQQVLLGLIEKGWSREKAYDKVQTLAMISFNEDKDYRGLLEEDAELREELTKEEIASFFDYGYHLKNVDSIFKRLGLE